MADETRGFLIQFMAETGSAVTAINWLGRAMQRFPSHAVSAAAETEVAMAELDSALRVANTSATDLSSSFASMGRNVTDMLGAAGAAAKVGIEGEKNLTAFAEASRKFGFVTKTSAKEAGKSLSDLSIVMGYETVGDVEKLASGMTFLSRRTNVSTNDLQALMRQTGRAAKEVGVTEAAVLGLATSFSQQGMRAREAIGPLSAIFKKMQYEPLMFGQALNLSAEEMEKFAKATPDKQLEIFMTGLGKMSKTEAEFTLEGIGIASGTLATKMWQAGVQSKNFGKYIGWASEAMKKNTALTDEAGKVEKTLTQQLKEMGFQLKAIFFTAGKLLVPILNVMVMGLRGLLIVVQAIPSPILAAAAAFSALGASILMGTWAAQTKLVTSAVLLIATTIAQMKAVGGLTGAYNKLTSAQWAQSTAEVIQLRRRRLALLESAGRKYVPPKGLLPMAPGGANVMRSAVGTSGVMTTLTAASAALGVSIAALIGIILAVVATLVVMGVMIYKGVQMMKSADAQTRALGATLIFLTGPLGVILLGFMALAKPLKEAGKQIYAAIQPIIPLFQKLAPLLYAIGAVFAVVFSPIIIPIVAFFAVLYALIPLVVGMVEGFVSALAYGLEPLVPVADALGEAFGWLAEQLGMVSGEGGGFYDVMRWIGAAIGAILGALIGGPIKALVWMIGGLISIFTEFDVILWGIGELFVWLGEVAADAWAGIVDIVTWSMAQIMKPISWLGSIWSRVTSALLSGLNKIMSPLKGVWSMFTGIASAAASVWESITGSSPWHIQESMGGEVIPALDKTRQAFDDIADSSFGVMQTARVRRTAAGPTIAPTTKTAAARMPAPAAPPPAPPATGPKEVHISVPVTLVLDGMVVGRAVVEQIVQLNERLMNAPGYPLRGVEPAY